MYGRRAGAELCFESTIKSIIAQNSNIEWVIFCNEESYSLITSERWSVVPVYVKWLDNQYKKAFWLEFISQRVLPKFKLDCFWIPSGCNHFPGRWNIPILTTFHDLGEYHVENKYSRARLIYRKLICIPRSVKRSSLFTSVSKFTAKDLTNVLNVERNKIDVIYNGYSPYSFVSSSNCLSRYKLKKAEFFFTPGRTDYVGKGLDILLKSFRQFHENYPNYKLVLVGPEGEGYDSFLKDLKSDEGCSSSIMYLGRVDTSELSCLYENCLATIISSRFEGFGFPILEAISHNVPVICSNAGALPEVGGDDIYVFDSGNSLDLLDRMINVASLSLEEKERILKKARKRLDLFTWENCASAMVDEFYRLLNLKNQL